MTADTPKSGDDGRRAEAELAAVAEEAGILLAGPNGQGIVSTPSSLCAQMVAPYPPAGRIGIASQSGNIVSTFENLALSTGVGISRAVSAGNAAVVEIADYLEFFAADPATDVGLAYLEGVRDGRALFDALRRAARQQPLVLVHGGATAGGRQAAASHTGALATDERDLRGHVPAGGREPRHHRGRGVRSGRDLRDPAAPARTERRGAHHRRRVGRAHRRRAGALGAVAPVVARRLLAAIDALLPPRWSRGNPIDLAAAETRDTIPQILELLAAHDSRRRGALPRIGRAVEPGEAHAHRRVRDGPRSRAHHRVPRTPGRALRAGRGRCLRHIGEAHPDRHGTCRDRSRQPRAAHGAARPARSATGPPIAPSPRWSISGVARGSSSGTHSHEHLATRGRDRSS